MTDDNRFPPTPGIKRAVHRAVAGAGLNGQHWIVPTVRRFSAGDAEAPGAETAIG